MNAITCAVEHEVETGCLPPPGTRATTCCHRGRAAPPSSSSNPRAPSWYKGPPLTRLISPRHAERRRAHEACLVMTMRAWGAGPRPGAPDPGPRSRTASLYLKLTFRPVRAVPGRGIYPLYFIERSVRLRRRMRTAPSPKWKHNGVLRVFSVRQRRAPTGSTFTDTVANAALHLLPDTCNVTRLDRRQRKAFGRTFSQRPSQPPMLSRSICPPTWRRTKRRAVRSRISGNFIANHIARRFLRT